MERRFFASGSIPQVPCWELGDGTAQVATALVAGPAGPIHDPPLEPRDEVVFLLTAAAEIEHALMVQYLYAAYSVHVLAGGGRTRTSSGRYRTFSRRSRARRWGISPQCRTCCTWSVDR
ncbi:MAG: ferritin-like domain-containing protein [Pseudonocardiaceae bacterium]